MSQTSGFAASSLILLGKFLLKRGFYFDVSSGITFDSSMFSCVEGLVFVKASKLSRNTSELSLVEGN